MRRMDARRRNASAVRLRFSSLGKATAAVEPPPNFATEPHSLQSRMGPGSRTPSGPAVLCRLQQQAEQKTAPDQHARPSNRACNAGAIHRRRSTCRSDRRTRGNVDGDCRRCATEEPCQRFPRDVQCPAISLSPAPAAMAGFGRAAPRRRRPTRPVFQDILTAPPSWASDRAVQHPGAEASPCRGRSHRRPALLAQRSRSLPAGTAVQRPINQDTAPWHG
jgi:hypothetical protein